MKEIFERRSIRSFRKGEIPKERIRELVEAGLCAPTAMGIRPWHFVVITKRSVLDRIPDVHPYAKMSRSAPLAIVVCGDTKLQNNEGYMAQDLSAATENILLMATSQGLGSVWCGVYPRRSRMRGFSELLGIPDGIIPFSLVVIGEPDERPEEMDRYDESRIHFQEW